MKVAVLISPDGRDDIVSACLEECRRQCDQVEAEGKYSFEIILGSQGNDASSQWDACADEIPDFCLWMGRPVILKDGALASLFMNSEFLRHRAIITGSVCDPDYRLVFGGRSKRGKLVDPDPIIPVPCHLYDTALLLVPRFALRKVKVPSDIFRLSFFDYGYGEKAFRAGVSRVVAPGVVAETSDFQNFAVWKDASRPLRQRTSALIRSVFHELLRIVHSIVR